MPPRSSIRILAIGKHIGFAGGIERHVFQTARAFREAGMAVDYAGEAASRDADCFRGVFSRVFPLAEAADAPADYDLVLLHKLCPLPALRQLRRKYGGRLIFIAHDHDLYCMRHHYYTPFGRCNCHRPCSLWRCGLCSRLSSPRQWSRSPLESWRLLRELRGHRAVALSEFMRGNLLRNGFDGDKIALIHPFVEPAETPRRHFMPDGVLRILFLGQLIRGKGCDLLLRALERLQRPFRLVVAGDGNDRAMLEAMSASPELAGRVLFTGWLNEPERLLRHCDVLAFPTRWQEPFGLGGLEAMAQGVPVVAFNDGGVGEWLRDGVTGLAVPPGDIAGFAASLARLHDERGLAQSLGLNAISCARREFSKAGFMQAMAALAAAAAS